MPEEQQTVIEDLPWDPAHRWQPGDPLTIAGTGWVQSYEILDVAFPHPNKNWARLTLRPKV